MPKNPPASRSAVPVRHNCDGWPNAFEDQDSRQQRLRDGQANADISSDSDSSSEHWYDNTSESEAGRADEKPVSQADSPPPIAGFEPLSDAESEDGTSSSASESTSSSIDIDCCGSQVTLPSTSASPKRPAPALGQGRRQTRSMAHRRGAEPLSQGISMRGRAPGAIRRTARRHSPSPSNEGRSGPLREDIAGPERAGTSGDISSEEEVGQVPTPTHNTQPRGDVRHIHLIASSHEEHDATDSSSLESAAPPSRLKRDSPHPEAVRKLESQEKKPRTEEEENDESPRSPSLRSLLSEIEKAPPESREGSKKLGGSEDRLMEAAWAAFEQAIRENDQVSVDLEWEGVYHEDDAYGSNYRCIEEEGSPYSSEGPVTWDLCDHCRDHCGCQDRSFCSGCTCDGDLEQEFMDSP